MQHFDQLPKQLQQWVIAQTQSTPTDLDFDTESDRPVIREEDPTLTAKIEGFSSLKLEDWNLSASVQSWLRTQPELVEWFAQERAKPPFSAEYTPTIVDIMYNDVRVLRCQSGVVTYQAEHLPPQIRRIEFYFDEELAVSIIDGETIVDRIKEMAELDSQLGRLGDFYEAIR